MKNDIFRKKLPSKPKLPQLPEDKLEEKIEAQVRDIWMRGSGGEVVGEFEKNQCTRTDLRTLKGKVQFRNLKLKLILGLSWLNDEVMNFYYGLIAGRAKANPDLPSVHHFSTFFYQTLSSSGYARVKRWTRKINIFDFER